MSVSDDLKAYIDAAIGREAVWGFDDCSPFAHRWGEQFTGRRIIRPAYHSEQEAMAIIARAGSLDSVWRDIMAENGISETGNPALGDVGVVDTGAAGQVGGIFLAGGYFVWRTRRSVVYLQPRHIVSAWCLQP